MSDSLDQRTKSKSTTEWINPSRPFKCSRCVKRFPSLHALGGHQNAHKEERREERRLEAEKRLALLPPPLTPPVPIVQPQQPANSDANTASTGGGHHLASFGNNSATYDLTHSGVLVHPLPTAGFVYACPQGHFFVPAAAADAHGPTTGTHQVIPWPYQQNYQNPIFPTVNTTNPMVLVNYFPAAGSTSSMDQAGLSNTTGYDHQPAFGADDQSAASEVEEQDLTLRL